MVGSRCRRNHGPGIVPRALSIDRFWSRVVGGPAVAIVQDALRRLTPAREDRVGTFPPGSRSAALVNAVAKPPRSCDRSVKWREAGPGCAAK